MSALLAVIGVVAAVMSAVAAMAARATSERAVSLERSRLTVELLRELSETEKRTIATLSPTQLAILPSLDWQRYPRHPVMDKVIEFLEAGELLAAAWRAELLNIPLLVEHRVTLGANYHEYSKRLLPAIRGGPENKLVYEAFERLLERCYIRLPDAVRRTIREEEARRDNSFEMELLIASAADHPDLKSLAPHLRSEFWTIDVARNLAARRSNG